MCFKSDYGRYIRLFQKMAPVRTRRIFFVLVMIIVMLSPTGCMFSSISDSSDSFSTSSSSLSKSSNSSSDDEKESYIRDIRQYTVVYTRSNSGIEGFFRGLSTISEKHGVTDWEAYSATYLGIGAGFAQAAVTQEQLDMYCSYLAAGDQLKVAAIKQGFSKDH